MKISSIFSSQRLRVGVVGSLSIKFLSAFFAFVNGVILARLLSLNDFGVYVLAFSTATILSVPISLGFPDLLTRYISKYIIEDNFPAIKGLLKRVNKYVFYALLLMFILISLSYILWWKIYDEKTIQTFWLSFVLVPLLVYGNLRASSLRGLKLIILGELPDTLIRNLLFGIGLLIYYILDINFTPQIAMLLHIGAAFTAFLIGYWMLKIHLLESLQSVKPVFYTKYWIKNALPYSITQCVGILKNKSINYILVLFGNFEAVALFDVAMRGATLVSFTLSAINSAISPFIASAFSKNNLKSIQRIVTKSNRIVFVFSLPVALIFIIGGKGLISWVFGEEYILSYIPLVILCVGQIIHALTGASGPVLNMTGNQRYLSKLQIALMIASLSLSFPLIYLLDSIGAAIVFALIIIVQNILLVIYIKRKLKINMSIFS